jgi:hypothetical protein
LIKFSPPVLLAIKDEQSVIVYFVKMIFKTLLTLLTKAI